MMDVLIFALKLLAGTLIVTPFVGAIGCAWINHWFKTKQQSQNEEAKKAVEEFVSATKKLVEKAKNEAKQTENQ